MRAIQKWNKNKSNKQIEELLTDKSDKKRKKTPKGKFPTIEKFILEKREERAKKNRDRSFKWMDRESKKLLADKDELNKLDLTEYERENIDEFKASDGWKYNVIKRNDLIKRRIHSQRKMGIGEYLDLRVGYLRTEREYLASIGIIKFNELKKSSSFNADEVPSALQMKKDQQISKPGEKVQVVPPPIVNFSEYRDCTLCSIYCVWFFIIFSSYCKRWTIYISTRDSCT